MIFVWYCCKRNEAEVSRYCDPDCETPHLKADRHIVASKNPHRKATVQCNYSYHFYFRQFASLDSCCLFLNTFITPKWASFLRSDM